MGKIFYVMMIGKNDGNDFVFFWNIDVKEDKVK